MLYKSLEGIKFLSKAFSKAFQIAIAFGGVLIATFRDVFASEEACLEADDRPIQDCDLIGDYNFRTQRFDSGTDPAGWYEDDA